MEQVQSINQSEDNHLVITWNHDNNKFQVNVVGEAKLAEVVGLLEFAKMEVLAAQSKQKKVAEVDVEETESEQ